MSAPTAPDPLTALRAQVADAAAALDGEASLQMTLERPPKPELGDYSTNAAMLLAPRLAAPPRDVASRLREALVERLGERAERVEVAGPGFINLFLSARWHRQATIELLQVGDGLGRGAPTGERALVEFVSANPTGPLTAAGGRHAAYGDSLARILEQAGTDVEREYLLNDVGGQIRRFAESIAARMRGEEPPEEGYAGEYVADLAAQLEADGVDPADLDELGRRGAAAMKERVEATLDRFGVVFDTWFSERSLHEAGEVEAAVAELERRGHAYRSEGATWLRTTESGDDKDRVLIRADGEPTYFAADIAYHRNKLGRGADRLIDVLGSDHHGYVARMKAAFAALGSDPERYEPLIIQFVHLVDGAERAQMSKRRGDFVTLDELIDDIGVDAARFLMLQRSHDTTVDLDLDLARQTSQENPVYYVQYAHARIASILRKAATEAGAPGDEAVIVEAAADEEALAASAEPAERALVRRLLELPGEVAAAAERRAPHRLCGFASATAADFHAFYRDCRVVGAGEETEAARLGLCVATRRTIAATLDLLGVSAPERM